MQKLTCKPEGEACGFILFPARFGEEWGKIDKDRHLFIHSSDFEYLLDPIKSVFLLEDPETGEIREFNPCRMNWISKGAWEKIIPRIKAVPHRDASLQEFVNQFCKWISDHLEWADEIMVEGTL